jgi:hypothetical protein
MNFISRGIWRDCEQPLLRVAIIAIKRSNPKILELILTKEYPGVYGKMNYEIICYLVKIRSVRDADLSDDISNILVGAIFAALKDVKSNPDINYFDVVRDVLLPVLEFKSVNIHRGIIDRVGKDYYIGCHYSSTGSNQKAFCELITLKEQQEANPISPFALPHSSATARDVFTRSFNLDKD